MTKRTNENKHKNKKRLNNRGVRTIQPIRETRTVELQFETDAIGADYDKNVIQLSDDEARSLRKRESFRFLNSLHSPTKV